MSIGRMQHSLKIQAPTRTADDGGGSTISWTDEATVFGRIEPQGGSERLYGDQLEGVESYIITIRFRRGITNKYRILYSFAVDGTSYSRTFNITRVENAGERDKYLKLYCTEGVAV